MTNQKLSEENSASLDFMRAISAQLVVIGHGISFCGILTFLHEPNFPWMQNIAVVVFFILSGFLISYSAAKNKNEIQYGFYHYCIDRFSRIYTAFIPAIIFVLIIDIISITLASDLYKYYGAFNIQTFIGNILMLQDFPKINFVTSFGSARPFWTLAIEWWIYLFFGFIIFIFIKKKRITVLDTVIFVVLSLVPLYNLIGGRGNGLALFWLYGALVFMVWNSRILDNIDLRKKFFLLIIFAFMAIIRVMNAMTAYDPRFAFALSIVILLVVDISTHINFPLFFHKLSKFYASYSYTLYLIHYSIFDFLITHYRTSINPYILFLMGFFLSNLLAMLIGRYFEVDVTKKVKSTMYSWVKIFSSTKHKTNDCK